jgi:hypothetical protein
MGPDSKDKLQSPDELLRSQRELDALVETSRHLIAELQKLVEENKKLLEAQQALRDKRKQK